MSPNILTSEIIDDNKKKTDDTLASLNNFDVRLSQLEKRLAITDSNDASTALTKSAPSMEDSEQTRASETRFIVQLATYFRRNCSSAAEEIDSYAANFSSFGTPTLFASSDNTRVIIGVETASKKDADAIQELAFSLSKDDQFSKESLDQAVVRTNPNWKRTSCGPIKG